MKSTLYLFYRKCKAWIGSLCFFLCRVFPIKANRISVCAYEGRNGFCCNPKYLVEELHRRDASYEFVWFLNDMSVVMPDYIKPVPNTLWSRAYWLSTSKVWIDNYRKPYGTKKRRRQYYFNVNHYTLAIKSTGLWRGDGFSRMAYLVSKNDSDMMDALVTDSDWCDAVMPKAMLFDKCYLRTGAPRCDILYGDRSDARRAFRKRHHIPEDAKVCMYAPTFREGAKDGKRFVYTGKWSINFEQMLTNLSDAFGGEWYLCLRVHPQLAAGYREAHRNIGGNKVIDESKAQDMNELLASMDVYITDYSSAVFEAGFAGIPAFIYADDVDTYTRDRGSLLWDFRDDEPRRAVNNKIMTPQLNVELPFPIACNNEELGKAIMDFDMDAYKRKQDAFHREIGLVFDGQASKRLADVVEEKLL